MYSTVDINSMNGDYFRFAYNLDFMKENNKSIFACGMYGDIYRIEKATTAIFKNGKLIANSSTYFCF